MGLTEKQYDILRALVVSPARDVPGGIVGADMDELIKVGHVSVLVVSNLFSYEITESGRAAVKRADGLT